MSHRDQEPHARPHEDDAAQDLSSRAASEPEKDSNNTLVYELRRTGPGSVIWRLRAYESDGTQILPTRMIWARTLDDAKAIAERAIEAMR